MNNSPNSSVIIDSPVSDHLQELCQFLRERAPQLESPGAWPAEQLRRCGEHGVFQWFAATEQGGQGWTSQEIIHGYLALSSACLTTTFVITQLSGALRRIADSENRQLRTNLLPSLLCGEQFATIGISHLTTSRRHLAKPVLTAEQVGDRFLLNGFSPWVTGAAGCQYVVTGATMRDQRQILIVVPLSTPGVVVSPPAKLVGLSASQTGEVQFENAEVGEAWLLDGPVHDVMARGVGGGTGGIQTSTLALGLAQAALDFLQKESEKRDDLHAIRERMADELDGVKRDLLAVAGGEVERGAGGVGGGVGGGDGCSIEQLRVRANSLVLRATQAALTAAKGTGYVVGHPTGRWCREALFFLVWSCPQAVLHANLCEMAGID